MWTLDNKTPFSAERSWVRDRDGRHLWIVAVKATYNIGTSGQVDLADDQPPPLLEPEYLGEPGVTSLRCGADLIGPKPTTDVLINAFAYAPKGRPTSRVDVGVRIGPIMKTLKVFGLRVYSEGFSALSTTSPRPFVRQPITYEWAYGGTDQTDPNPAKHAADLQNPIGKGFVVRSSRRFRQAAHTIEYPEGQVANAGPAGFGAIGSHWKPRIDFAGTYDERWQKSRHPLLPTDFDPRFWQCAPLDQQPPRPLTGGEPVALVNLTPEGACRFELPRHHFTFQTRFGRRVQEHRARLATVLIEPDARQLSMVWHTHLPVGPRDVDYLDKTSIIEKRKI